MARAKAAALPAAESNSRHPRRTTGLIGHEKAEAAFLESFRSGKLHHAWMLTGPSGIGKATFAYRIARFLLQEPPPDPSATTMEVAADTQVNRLVAGEGHSNLLTLSRPWDPDKKKYKSEVTVGEVRRMNDFFRLAAGRPGWRICIVDTADEMNVSAANALLKTLEEPPSLSLIILIADTPGRLLPTIRSRCRRLSMQPLSNVDVQSWLENHYRDSLDAEQIVMLARMARGSIGRACRLADNDGVELYRDILALLNTIPQLDALALEAVAAKWSKAGEDDKFALLFSLLTDWLERLHTETDPAANDISAQEVDLRRKLSAMASPADWVELWEQIRELERTATNLYMDRKQTIKIAFQMIQKACARPVQR